MKTLFPVVLLCCEAGRVSGQAPALFPVDKATRRICYAAVVPAAGVSPADLHARALAWAGSVSPATPPVVVQEPDTEVITASGAQPFVYTYASTKNGTRPPQHYTTSLVLHYTAKLALRAGRYRYELTDFVFEYPTARPPSPTQVPAEDDLIRTRAITEEGGQMLASERQGFAAAAAKLQAQLQERLRTPVAPAEARQ